MSVGVVSSPSRWALALLSAAITAHQLALMQVLGYVHWHHFAYMVVAVALLGFGAAGTVLTLWRDPLTRAAPGLWPWLAAGAAAAMPLGVRLSQTGLLTFDLHLLFVQPGQWWALLGSYACLLPAFFLGGLAISLVLTVEARQAGRFYFANLLGSGVGGVVGWLALELVAPGRLPLVPAALALGAAVLFRPHWSHRATWVVAALLLAIIGWSGRDAALPASQFKPISRALELPDATVVAQWPSVHGWVEVLRAPALRPAPVLSLNFAGEIPAHPAVFINGYSHGSLLPPESVKSPWMSFTTGAVAYAVAPRRDVLLLDPAPGGAVALARAEGARQVVVTEPHGSLARFLAAGGRPGVPAPEWSAPTVDVQSGHGRGLLRQLPRAAFDLVVFPPAGAAGGAGMTSATEEFLLTRQAVEEAWVRLRPHGALVLTAPMEFPVRHALRLLALIVEALEAQGVSQPAVHLVAVRGWNEVAFLVQRAPVSPAQAEAVRAFCADRSFDPLLLPGLQPEERNALNHWPDERFFAQVDQLLGADRATLYSEYPFRIQPPTDERPWFGHFLKWSRLRELGAAFGEGRLPYFELGTIMVALTFAQLLVLAVLCILLPLFRLGRIQGRRRGTLLYFAGLGAGFMLIEIGLMLRLHAWLGNPLTAAAVVLIGLLAFAGWGSLLSERLPAQAGRRLLVAAACVTMIAVIGLVFWSVSPGAWPTLAKVTLALGLMLPLGVVMGMAFPVGLRDLERREPSQVPWAWGINGCVSVATPAGAMLLAMEGGISLLFVAAMGGYALAAGGAWLDR